MKTCTKCSETRDLTRFNNRSDGYGYQSVCKDCKNANAKKWNEKNKDKIKARPKRKIDKDKMKEHHLQRHYGISLNDYNSMLEKQNECCSICGAHRSTLRKALCVDHCHTTGKIRGLLCNTCNIQVVGVIEKYINLVDKAISYIKENR